MNGSMVFMACHQEVANALDNISMHLEASVAEPDCMVTVWEVSGFLPLLEVSDFPPKK